MGVTTVKARVNNDPDRIVSHYITAYSGIHVDVVKRANGVTIYAAQHQNSFHVMRVLADGSTTCNICGKVNLMHATAVECDANIGHRAGQQLGGNSHCRILQWAKEAEAAGCMVRVPLHMSRRVAALW